MAAEDIVLVAVIFMLVATGLFVVAYVGDTMATAIKVQPTVNESSYAVAVYDSVSTTVHKFDLLFLAVFIGTILSVIILSWFVPAHPIFYFAYLLVMIIGVIVSTVVSNVWSQVSTTAKITSMLTYFPITNHIMEYLPLYISVIGFVGITVMFGKIYSGGETI